MSVLTPEQARKALDDIVTRQTAGCALCPAIFSDSIPAQRASFGWLCPECKQRHETFRTTKRAPEV